MQPTVERIVAALEKVGVRRQTRGSGGYVVRAPEGGYRTHSVRMEGLGLAEQRDVLAWVALELRLQGWAVRNAPGPCLLIEVPPSEPATSSPEPGRCLDWPVQARS